MRKIIVLTFISMDGVMQAPGGQEEDTSGDFKYGGWTVPFFDEFSNKMMDKQLSQPFDLLLGKFTYDIWADYWPKHEDDPIGDKFSKVHKYVVDHNPFEPTWKGTTVLSGSDVVEQIKKLKAEDGPDLQVQGSGELIQTLFENDLVDEMWLKIFPITLGKGKNLFGNGTQPMNFKLTDSQTSPSGVIFANYVRDGEVKTGSFTE